MTTLRQAASKPRHRHECIDNWGDYSSVAVSEGEVTHWMPLPEAPAE